MGTNQGSIGPDAKIHKPIMVIGPVGSGKSTLLKALDLTTREVKKTEAITYSNKAIDTPGEMLSIPRFYNSLILNSVRSSLILFLMDANRPTQLPSRMAQALRAPVVGVISKLDAATDRGRQQAHQILTNAGVKEIVGISVISGFGVAELKKIVLQYIPDDSEDVVLPLA